MLVRKNLIFSLIFDMQYYYAVDLQTDNKGSMTLYLLLECMSKPELSTAHVFKYWELMGEGW